MSGVHGRTRLAVAALAGSAVLALLLPLCASAMPLLVAARGERDGACTLLEIALAARLESIELAPNTDYTDVRVTLGLAATSSAPASSEHAGVPLAAAKEVRTIALVPGDGLPALHLKLAAPMQVQAAIAVDGRALDLRLAPLDAVDCAQKGALLAPPTREDPDAGALVGEAEAAIRAGDLGRAEAALGRSLERDESRWSPRTRELLGVVHERRGEEAPARALYEDYLARYPSGEGAARVKQRLLALGRSHETPDAPHESGRGWRTEVHGASTQLYMSDKSRSDFDDALHPELGTATDRRVNVDEFLSAADVTLSASGPGTRIEARASAAYVAEYRPVVLVGADRQQGSYPLLYDRWLSVTNERFGLAGRVGRQTRFGDGIFGRFDGAWLGWHLSPRMSLNVVTGHPVLSPRETEVDTTRAFEGISFEYEPPAENWWASLHWLEQYAGAVLDREAVGFELKTEWRRVAFDALADYDLHFERLNAAYIDALVGFEDGATLSLRGQWLHYPLLAVSNSIIGQPVPTIDAVREQYDPATLEQLALDRTLGSRQVTASYTRRFGKRLTLVADASLAETRGSPGSGGVPAFPGTGRERYIGLQLIRGSLASEGDTWSFALRSASLELARVVVLEFRVRVPLTPRLAIAPQLSYLDREQRADDGRLEALRPALRFIFNVTASSELEGRLGGTLIDQRFDGPAVFGSRQESAVIGHLGYRIVF